MASFKPVQLAYSSYEPVGEVHKNLAPIIYVHGVTDYKGAWEEIPQVVANATRRMGFALDSRNHGDSDWSNEFNFDINVDDLLHFMDKMKIKKAIIVGHSMGGITAIKTALRRPERVEKIVVEDMVVRKIPQHAIALVLEYIKLLKEALDKASTDLDESEMKKFIMKHILVNTPSEMKSLLISEKEDDLDASTCFLSLHRGEDGRFKLKCNLDVIEKSLRNRDTLVSDPEGLFDGPACFIYGKFSPMLVGADEYHIKQFFPKAVFYGVDDVGHNVHNSKPLEFTEILLKYIS